MAAIYTVFTSPSHAPIPNHLPTLIVTPHGQPSNILYSYLHTNFNAENYLLTPSPQGDLCVAKLFPPRPPTNGKPNASDPGHGSSASRAVRCEASRNLKWTIANTGVMSPIYKLSLPSPDSADLPLFQISKPNPNATHWSMFYFAYAGHLIPPKRIEFGKIQKNPGNSGGGTRISITGKTPEEKAVWQTLGEGNEDCVEWVVLCAALNLLDDEILKAAEKSGNPIGAPPPGQATRPPMPGPNGSTGPGMQLRDGPAPSGGVPPQLRAGPAPNQVPGPNRLQRPPPQGQFPPGQGPPRGGYPPGPGFDPRGPPPNMDPRGPPMNMDPRAMGGGYPQGQGFDPRGPPLNMDPRGPPMDPRGPPMNMDPRAMGGGYPQGQGFDPRGPPPPNMDPRNQDYRGQPMGYPQGGQPQSPYGHMPPQGRI